jgi:hypothetical protein
MPFSCVCIARCIAVSIFLFDITFDLATVFLEYFLAAANNYHSKPIL